MTNSDNQPIGILETLIDKIENTNNRLDILERKIDRIWELIVNLPPVQPPVPQANAENNTQLPLFEEEHSLVNAEAPEVLSEETSSPELEFEEEDIMGVASEDEAEKVVEPEEAEQIPHWKYQKERYKEYLSDLIQDLREQGMSYNAIAKELNERKLKTVTGLNKWTYGIAYSIGKWVSF